MNTTKLAEMEHPTVAGLQEGDQSMEVVCKMLHHTTHAGDAFLEILFRESPTNGGAVLCRHTTIPPTLDGLTIMGCKTSCKSWPNLTAVLGIWGMDMRNTLSK